MGCSPSRGKLFGAENALLDGTAQDATESTPLEDQNEKTLERGKECRLYIEEDTKSMTEWPQVAPDVAGNQSAENLKSSDLNVMPQKTGDEVLQTDEGKKLQRRKKDTSLEHRRWREQQRKSSIMHSYVDYPLHMVRAHQAAYEFLNPNISKYESLLGLLDQAAQAQWSLRPMMTTLILHFEEINQALEEMAEEGELMLKQHSDYMAILSGMMGPPGMPAKPSTVTSPPPDLLQLLQHSTDKMRLMGSSVKTLGDTTLNEAVECFTSFSKMLTEKLQAKHAAEKRLTQVLTRVEEAAVKKSKPEDSALHSEDSGIGAENESLTGSERHRSHRGSAGSGSCGSVTTSRAALANHLPIQAGLNEGEGEDDDDEDDDDSEYNGNQVDRPERKRSNSSPPDPSLPLPYMDRKYTHELPAVKSSMTAANSTKPEHATSTRGLNIVIEFQKSQKELDKRMKKMAKSWGNTDLEGSYHRIGLRRYSLCGSGIGRCAQKGLLKTNQLPCTSAVLEPQPPGRHSVRRLINTFSQGVDGRPGQSLANIPPHIRRPRKIHLPPDTGSGDGTVVFNGNNNNNSWPDSRDALDVDSLPPPPPEVLMDNSFQSTKDTAGDEEESQGDSTCRRLMRNQRSAVSHRLRASVQNVEVLPNRARPSLISISPVCHIRQDAVIGVQSGQDAEQRLELDPEMEKSASLYQQACKIIHLGNAAESPVTRNPAQQGGKRPSPLQAGMVENLENNEIYEAEMPPCSLPVTAPPVSRVRLPPSCPSVCHRFPRPPTFRPQPISRPSSHPSSLGAVTRPRGDGPEEIIPSVSFYDARSVFCQSGLQNAQTWTASCISVFPRPWGEASRGRVSTRGTACTLSEQRPNLTSHTDASNDPASSTQAQGSETVHIITRER